jgi:hypothetical protein
MHVVKALTADLQLERQVRALLLFLVLGAWLCAVRGQGSNVR